LPVLKIYNAHDMRYIFSALIVNIGT